jgi:2-keto-4-pentenoate hydratase/2-oxohepta-3-ene-1,7-dioic acid hydratase in catechol pathway
MKLASFAVDGEERFGIVVANGIVDLRGRVPGTDLRSTLETLRPKDLAAFANASPDWALERVQWLPPISRPMHTIGIGLNTRSHFEETAELMKRQPGDYPVHPRLFMRSPLSCVGHGQPITIPRVSTQLDYEGEIAIVIGRGGRYIEARHALEHIGGYSCYNDGSVRDFQVHSNQVTAGKNFFSSGSFGPWMVTSDEVQDPSTLTLQTRVNGELRQSLVMNDLLFSFADLIAYISQILPLQVGDVILTGSPAGIGALTGNWLEAGDVLEIEVPQIGLLSNPIVRED